MKRTQRKFRRSPWTYVVLAVVAATLAALSAARYNSLVESRVVNGLSPVSVLIAADTLLPGTTLKSAIESGQTKITAYPAASVPDGAIRPGESSLFDNETVRSISSGEILLRGMFPPTRVKQLGLDIPDGLLATTIEVAPQAKVGTFLQPYDYVVVYLTTTGQQARQTSVLLPKALVLAVGKNTKRGVAVDSEGKADTVTLGVSPSDSLTLVSGLQSGEIYLGLLTPSTDTFER